MLQPCGPPVGRKIDLGRCEGGGGGLLAGLFFLGVFIYLRFWHWGWGYCTVLLFPFLFIWDQKGGGGAVFRSLWGSGSMGWGKVCFAVCGGRYLFLWATAYASINLLHCELLVECSI